MKKRALAIILTVLLTISVIPMVPVSAAVTVKSLTMKHMPTITQYMEQGNGYTSYTFDDDYNLIPCFYYITDFSGLQVTVVYSDNTSAVYNYDNDYYTFKNLDVTIDDGQDSNPWGTGNHTITVEIGGKTTTFVVSVKTTDVQKIEIVKNPLKMSYIEGIDGEDYGDGIYYYDIDLTGAEIRVTYKNGTTAVLAADEYGEFGGYSLNYTDDQFDAPWEIGAHTVTVSFCGKTTSYNVSVVANNVQKIEVTKSPDKTDYMQDVDGMDFDGAFYYFIDLTGMELKVTYTNGTSQTFTVDENFDGTIGGYELSWDDDQGYTPWELGSHTETLSYCGKSTSLTVMVVKSNISSISISKQPNKTEYLQNIDGYDMGEYDPEMAGQFYYELDLTGMEVTVYYDDQTNKTFTVDEDFLNFLNGYYLETVDDQYDTPWDAGPHDVTINYLGKSTQITVTVVQPPYIPGDINSDAKIDLKDVTTLSRYVAGWQSLTYNAEALDVNGDLIKDLRDVTTLSRYVAGWSVTIH